MGSRPAAYGRSGPTVVKLGGSLAYAPRLGEALAAIAGASAPVVVVPGGGPFADRVREAQPRMGIPDRAADDMAVLAMGQYALALACRHARFAIADSLPAMDDALDRGLVPVWLPWPMLRDADLPKTWQVTSDSLALWLAARIGAGRVVLIKSVAPHAAAVSAAALAEAGVVDAAFPAFLDRTGVPVWWLGPEGITGLAQILDGQTQPGARIVAAQRRQHEPT